MKHYRDLDTNQVYSEEELQTLFEQFKDELEHDNFEDYLESALTLGRQRVGGLVEAPWLAVMRDREDDDWGTGSFDPYEAEKMLRSIGSDEAYIAVIDDGICTKEVKIDEVDDLYD